MPEREFSEITLVYNDHIGNLNRARQIFEEETRELNEIVLQHLNEVVSRPTDRAAPKLRWSEPRDWSMSRDVTWINFMTGAQLSIDIRQPGYKIFRKAAGYVYFETVFHEPADSFVFQCRFENQNIVHADIDEQIIHRVTTVGEQDFPDFEHVKTNTAILFRRPLSSSLFDTINQIVDGSLRVIETSIDNIFPDDDYIEAGTIE